MRAWVVRQRWWATRVAMLPAHLLVFVVLTFVLVRAMPGDPVLVLLGQNYTPQAYAALQADLGLAGSLPEQLVGYVVNLVQLDLGQSLMTGREVVAEFAQRLPGTLELAMCALAISALVSCLVAYVVVLHPRNPVSATVRAYARAAGAIPEYVLAVAGLIVFYAALGWAPAPVGRLDIQILPPPRVTGFPLLDAVLAGNVEAAGSIVSHLVLPVGVMVLAQSALLIKLWVAGLEDAIDDPVTRFRVASGASRAAVVLSVYRRAAPPVITMTGTLFGYLIGGAVVMEGLFGFNGMGQYAVDAVNSGDFIALQGFLLVVAAMSLVVFLVVDIVNMLLDPRRRPGVRVEES
ncbi:ABC transporter permease [Cellulomonas dongxiuzhuiae]|uniref:ABC transporter permease n=1 Tax=Cellulomonas dongxiuzhuiae TaxID=2819979 RepID=A0ABX8GJ64_9CELL|nr:ABC transporter permease [Cellulomonas dongxiuzhuiae]MBO3095245.1 ABC transporter permease [Cellulomonas dongxiuzhuiae]QWC16242.1 ABC transporter permease [Cellulomonas dongxiuzhuiae]